MTVGTDVKSCYTSIKSAEATLEQLLLKTTSNEKKEVYQQAQNQLTEIKQELNQQILFLAREEPQY